MGRSLQGTFPRTTSRTRSSASSRAVSEEELRLVASLGSVMADAGLYEKFAERLPLLAFLGASE
jgi:hypothetical protein